MKIIARIFLPFFTLWLLIFPARSYAVIPLLVPLVSAITAGGTLTALDTLGIGVAVTGLAYIASNSLNPVKVYTSPNAPMDVPTGWTPSASGSQPIPPSNGSPPKMLWGDFGNGIPYVYNTPFDACKAKNSAAAYYANGACYFSNAYAFAFPTQHSVCDAGYGLISSTNTCVLTDLPSVKKPDNGSCEVIRTGNTYVTDPLNPACALGGGGMAALKASGASMSVSAGKFSITHSDGRGFSTLVNPDGTTTFSVSLLDSNGNTVTKTFQLDVPNAQTGATPVIGMSSQTTQGAGTLSSPTPVTSSPPLVIPNDYNRESTQGQIAGTLNDIKNGVGVVQPTDSVSLKDAASALDNLNTDIINSSNTPSPISLPSFLNPFVPAACTVLGWTFGGHTVNFDICPYVPTIKSILSASLYIFTASMLFSMFLRRPVGK